MPPVYAPSRAAKLAAAAKAANELEHRCLMLEEAVEHLLELADSSDQVSDEEPEN